MGHYFADSFFGGIESHLAISQRTQLHPNYAMILAFSTTHRWWLLQHLDRVQVEGGQKEAHTS